jgi:hypothetical protein
MYGRCRDHELLDRVEKELGTSLDGDPTDQVIREHKRAICSGICGEVVGDIGGDRPRVSGIKTECRGEDRLGKV